MADDAQMGNGSIVINSVVNYSILLEFDTWVHCIVDLVIKAENDWQHQVAMPR